jgi:hypothetical protein
MMEYTPRFPKPSEVAAMTRQQMFNRIARHMMLQNAKSVSSSKDKDCAYRSHRDNRLLACGVGILFPASLVQQKDFNNTDSIASVVEGLHTGELKAPKEFTKNLEQNLTMLERVQAIHDSVNVSQWRSSLHYMAQDYKLDPSAVDKAFTQRTSKRD